MSATATFSNTEHSYGGVTKAFHWLTALLILTAFPIGLIANDYPYDTSAQLAVKATLFSVHKTLGVTVVFVAVARILWALSQPKPGLLHPDRRLESFAAEFVHWMLYVSLIFVPLSGWIDHASTTGFAPIWWPFGQDLPFVPKSLLVSNIFGTLHDVFTKILLAALVLHILGAVKHAIIDRDATLRRMLPGAAAVTVPAQRHSVAPKVAAFGLWALVVAGGVSLAMLETDQTRPETVALEAAPSEWAVQSGTLGISVRQFGSNVTGSFANWTTAISFDPEAAGGTLGNVKVDIDMGSLTLGTVTSQALGNGFLDSADHPTATFAGDIQRDGDGYVVNGTLDLVGQSAPVTLPFTLVLDGDTAHATGETVIDRRTFGVGMASHGDESALGFPVTISIDLTATRGE